MRLRSLLIFLSLAVFGTPAMAQDELTSSQAFFDAGYGYCDAVHIANLMGQGDSWDAKVRTGKLILKKKGSKAREIVVSARQSADQQGSICEYEMGYAYRDAETLATVWGIDTWDAKLKMSSMIRNERVSEVDEALTSGRTPPVSNPDIATAVFAGHNACDAALLAAFWGTNSEQAMERIGQTIAKTGRLSVEQDLAQARKSPSEPVKEACGYFATEEYTYDDADFLATVWGIDVYDAKMRIGEMRIAGKDAVLRGLLSQRYGE